MLDMKLKTILGVALVAGSFASCSVEDNESATSKVKEDYTREFIKQFGTIDRNQDWSVVEQKTVTMDLPKASHVKIYEKQGGVYRLAADYKDVTKQTITFDGLEGDDTPFLVYVDDAAYAVENGETLTVGAAAKGGPARAKMYPEGLDWINRGDKTIIKLSSTDVTLNVLANNNGKNVVDMGTVTEIASGNRGLLSKDVTVNFYPLYWNSPKKHTVGIYYNDQGTSQIVHIPVFADKTDTYVDDKDKEDLAFYTSRIGAIDYPVETDAENCWHYSHTKSILSPLSGQWDVTYGRGFKFRSRPYEIKPTTSLAAGIYVEVDGNYYYSDPVLNGGKKFFAQNHISNGDGTDDSYTYFCFDDPDDNGNEGDKDYNDLVLYTPTELTPITRDEVEWTVVCEDLGGTFDYDFNDIVFRVKHVSGNDYLTIYPMAAGGTLRATLCYKNTPISEEWHQHFGNGYEFTEMINTGRTEDHVIWPIRLEGIPTDWSMKAFTSDPNAKDGDFSIVVERADGTKTTVTGPSQGSAPQMLILPYEWQWPTELTHITKAYPDFGTWGSNYTNSNWVNNQVSDYLITGFGEGQVTATKAAKVVKVQ